MSKSQSSKVKLDFMWGSFLLLIEYATPTHLFLPSEILSYSFSIFMLVAYFSLGILLLTVGIQVFYTLNAFAAKAVKLHIYSNCVQSEEATSKNIFPPKSWFTKNTSHSY